MRRGRRETGFCATSGASMQSQLRCLVASINFHATHDNTIRFIFLSWWLNVELAACNLWALDSFWFASVNLVYTQWHCHWHWQELGSELQYCHWVFNELESQVFCYRYGTIASTYNCKYRYMYRWHHSRVEHVVPEYPTTAFYDIDRNVVFSPCKSASR